MPKTDAFGVVVIDGNDTTPFRAWAIPRLGAIDPSLVFLRRELATSWATFELDGAHAVVPVLVTGGHIEIIERD